MAASKTGNKSDGNKKSAKAASSKKKSAPTKSAAERSAKVTGRTTKASAATAGLSAPKASKTYLLAKVNRGVLKGSVPNFQSGDTVKVHSRIIEGNKERIQIFQGVVIKRHKGNLADATFTVRKVSYNIGVERTFPLHSPRVEKVEVVAKGEVRRARLFYLRDLQGKAAKIKTQVVNDTDQIDLDNGAVSDVDVDETGTELSESEAAEVNSGDIRQSSDEGSSQEGNGKSAKNGAVGKDDQAEVSSAVPA